MKTYDNRKRTISSSNSSSTQNNNAINSATTKLNADQFEKASKCMNKLVEYSSQLKRNIILDQVSLRFEIFITKIVK